MTADRKGSRRQEFTAQVLPWLIAAGGFLVYLGTLNAWISLRSLAIVARVSGWLWQPELHRPLNCLVFYPFRFLPEAWIPLALNLFTAACAALVLLVLARSVARLPHDRTHEQRIREGSEFSTLSTSGAWMPPLLAAMCCGLQLSFWEDATAATGEMISLVIVAGVIGFLLEFRITQKQSWLSGSAFLYGAGMTNDWTLIGLLPVFLVGVLWLKRLRFFKPGFLLIMASWGTAGLGLYLALPALQVFQPAGHPDFWAGLKANLKMQRDALSNFPTGAALVLALTSLLPLLVISIRWKSEPPHAGDDNRLTAPLTRTMFHLAHGAFLAVGLWIALDPPFSPRSLGLGTPLLTQYYLSALITGYCAGYFLLIGAAPVRLLPRSPEPTFLRQCVSKFTVGAAWLLLLALPAMLVWRNLDHIRATNGPALRQFARQLHRSLPAGRSVVLSESPAQLFLLMGELAARGHDKNALLLDVGSLPWGQYQIIKAGQFKNRWPVKPPTNSFELLGPDKLLALVSKFAAQEPVVYLHPSFSGYFELFTGRPGGAVQYLVPWPKGTPRATLDSRTAAANEQYWQRCWTDSLSRLAERTQRKPQVAPSRAAQRAAGLCPAPEQNATLAWVGAAYGRTLTHWGVQLQRLGRWAEAGVWFRRAVQLGPRNLAARINLDFNERYQRGDRQRLNRELVEKQLLDLFARHRNWEAVINDDGPVDEPSFLFETGRVLLAGGNPRQAIVEYARCCELAPEWPEPRLWLAQSHLAAREFTSVLRLTDSIAGAGLPQDGTGLAQFMFCRATALEALGRTNDASACIESVVARGPEDVELLSTAAEVYLRGRQFQRALVVLERLAARDATNLEMLSNRGLAQMQLARYEDAIRTLTAALSLAPSNQVVRLNRAIARLRAGELDAARADYERLLPVAPRSYQVLYGLAEIAWRKQDTNAAIQFYERCLALELPDPAERKLIAERVKQLRSL